MKKLNKLILFILIVGWLAPASGLARDKQEVRKSFSGKQAIRINTFSGDCQVKQGESEEIKVRFIHTYSNTAFQPQFLEEGNTLVLKEKLHLSESGNSKWYLTVPKGITIKFSTISGDFTVEGVTGNIQAGTVSGDMKARDCTGDLNLKSVSGDLEVEKLSGKITVRGVSSDLKVKELAGDMNIKTSSGDVEAVYLKGDAVIKSPSGDIRVKNSSGSFEIKTSSGEIYASEIDFKKKSFFKTASGDVYVSLSGGLKHDLTLDSASGDAVLNFNGHPIEGYFEFRTKKGVGKIESPFPFEKEEEFEKWGKTYVIKSFKLDFDNPKVCIYTSSGTAKLKEK
ncbi:MAG: DUF4097 domain-containing protein [bacterium]|nr:DUF4097 domain-containing protein [bacterium]